MVLQIVAHGAFRVGAQLDGTLVDLLESRTHGVADSAQHAHVERRRPPHGRNRRRCAAAVPADATCRNRSHTCRPADSTPCRAMRHRRNRSRHACRAMPVRPGRHAARFPIPLRHGTWSCPRRPSAVAAVSTRPAIVPVPDRFRSVRSADGSVPPSSRARPRRSCPMADPRRSMRAHARPAAESWRWPSACRGGRRPPTPVPPRQAGVPIHARYRSFTKPMT